MIYLKLFWSFFQIGLFSIGGGYAAIPLIQNQVVDINSWLTMSQFADIVTIAEMTPGPIAINAATFVGIQAAGIPGAIVATLGNLLAPSIIVITLAAIYMKYKELKVLKSVLSLLRVAVVAMIMSATLSILSMAVLKDGVVEYLPLIVFLVGFILVRLLKLSPIKTIFASGLIYLCISLLIG